MIFPERTMNWKRVIGFKTTVKHRGLVAPGLVVSKADLNLDAGS